ncbi:multidrug resistance protein MdtN [Klebsiella pneumoniae]|nr:MULTISPECIES: HlyD family secretion protein [Klebsiella]MDI3363650.1 HlyD family efflux transporter periplasmic adaptor subunit [Pantoea sp. V108_6]SBY69256.1 multidrug resistance protein MdtN [Klebsiella pneumoniae]HBR1627771.1 HlyD family efflux transporter periplasmic adaptor subunit [Klebsiella pneumoniae]
MEIVDGHFDSRQLIALQREVAIAEDDVNKATARLGALEQTQAEQQRKLVLARGLKRAVLRERTQAAAAAVREGEAEIDALRTDLASRRLLEEAGFYSHTAITRADHELRAAEERKEKLERDWASETAVKNGAEIDIGFDDDSGPKLGLLEGAVLATKREMQSAALDLASAKKHLRTLLDSEAALASASNGLRKATLVAGQSGRINTVLVGSGSEVPAGERLASLVDCHHPYALGVIPERQQRRGWRLGDAVRVEVGGSKYRGEVVSVSPSPLTSIGMYPAIDVISSKPDAKSSVAYVLVKIASPPKGLQATCPVGSYVEMELI